MKKGSGSWLCCLEWAALPSHSKPSSVPLLLVRSEGHGSATVTPQLRVLSTDFHLGAVMGEYDLNYTVIRMLNSNPPSEYVCMPCV